MISPQLAVNYSDAAVELRDKGRIEFDLFKCPAWPDLVKKEAPKRPIYIHFPLNVGSGIGDAMNSETSRPADWRHIDALMAETQTPMVNLHLSPMAKDWPALSLDPANPASIGELTACLIRDTQAVVKRFGASNVLVENMHSANGLIMPHAFLPGVIREVVCETRCQFLFDLSHARMAAKGLGMSEEEYIQGLPVEKIREIHITGIQRFDGSWIQRLRESGVDMSRVRPFEGRLMDHLPMTCKDWTFFEWAMNQVRSGNWGKPWLVAFEYGGIGSWWQIITDAQVLQEQVPRLLSLVKGTQ